MKKKFIVTISLVFTLILCCFLAACNTPADLALTIEQKAFYNSWMANIKDETPINRIAMLGSHDSGISTTKHAFKTMTKTQDYTIGEQLSYGCRYFDIRVSKSKSGELTIFHSIDKTGENFSDVTNDILQFINANKTEFLVLDFQHFDGDSQQSVIDKINSSGLINYAISNNTDMSDLDFVTSLKLSDMRGKVIIIWGSNQANGNTYPYLFRRNNDSCSIENAVLDSLYDSDDNKKPSDKFIAETIPKYFAHILSKPKGLTVLQAQLTASGLDNLKKLEDGHNQAMSAYIRGIEQNTANLTAVNIIMRDFVGSDLEKTNCVLHLNIAKNIVKDSDISTFEKFTKAQ